MIYNSKNIARLKELPVLEDGQLYIYVMLNYPQGNIKIGQTTNIIQRLQSLSGSNGGGNHIIKLYVSPSTYILSIEKTCHNHYDWYRIKGTEWFNGDKLNFDEVVEYVDSLFRTESFKVCNELRKEQIEKKRHEEEERKKLEEESLQQEELESENKKEKKSKTSKSSKSKNKK